VTQFDDILPSDGLAREEARDDQVEEELNDLLCSIVFVINYSICYDTAGCQTEIEHTIITTDSTADFRE
jgi:hypothetical protein